MDDFSSALLDRLIARTFEPLSARERLDFVERLFTDMPQERQERFLKQLIRQASGTTDHDEPRRVFIAWQSVDDAPSDIGPWQLCCNMMIAIDQAPEAGVMDAEAPARVFHALADETRIRIVKLLMSGEKRVDSLTRSLQAPQSTISHHLRVLKDADVVRTQRRGRNVFYALAPSIGTP